MFNKLLTSLSVFIVTFAALIGNVSAAVNVNTANEETLVSIKGIGPVKAKAMVNERDKNGPYRDAADLASRVKGLSNKSIEKLQKEGLTVDSDQTQIQTTATSGAQRKVLAPKKK